MGLKNEMDLSLAIEVSHYGITPLNPPRNESNRRAVLNLLLRPDPIVEVISTSTPHECYTS